MGRSASYAMSPTTTVPALPCVSLDETLSFWRHLAFEVTYTQRTPAEYAVIRYDDFELHLFGLKGLKPADNFSTCLVVRDEIELLHAEFVTRLRSTLGRIPVKGFPKITRMRPGQTRFTLTDVSGNSIIFIRRGNADEENAQAYKERELTPLQRAVALAARLRDYKNDDALAARTLDQALDRADHAPARDLAQALAARLDLAIAHQQSERAGELRRRFAALDLSDAERAALSSEWPDLEW